jgi:hypothetical protein
VAPTGAVLIPNHIPNALKRDELVAILSRGSKVHFLVHPADDTSETVRALAAEEGSEVLATHLRDHAEILALVASRERDVGGEA